MPENKKPKAVIFDFDDTLVDLATSKIKNADKLLPILLFANAEDIKLGIVTNRTPATDDEEAVKVKDFIDLLQNNGIAFQADLIQLYDMPLRQKIDELQKIHRAAQDDSILHGKNIQLNVLSERMGNISDKSEVILVDDNQNIINGASNYGYGAIKATDPIPGKQRDDPSADNEEFTNSRYIDDLASKTGLTEYARDLFNQPADQVNDNPKKITAALLYALTHEPALANKEQFTVLLNKLPPNDLKDMVNILTQNNTFNTQDNNNTMLNNILLNSAIEISAKVSLFNKLPSDNKNPGIAASYTVAVEAALKEPKVYTQPASSDQLDAKKTWWDTIKELPGRALGKFVLPAQLSTRQRDYVDKLGIFSGIVSKLLPANNFKEQKNNLQKDMAEGNIIATRHSIQTHDGASLDTIQITPTALLTTPKEAQHYTICALPNSACYESQLDEMRALAKGEFGNGKPSTVIGFNFRGVRDSRGTVKSKDDLVNDIKAQVQRLRDSGIPAEQITLKGRSIGAAAATIAAKQLHDEGFPVHLENGGSFSTTSKAAASFIRNFFKKIRLPKAGNFLSRLFEPKSLLEKAGWQMDAADAYKQLPATHKSYFHIKGDNMIDEAASLHKALDENDQKTGKMLQAPDGFKADPHNAPLGLLTPAEMQLDSIEASQNNDARLDSIQFLFNRAFHTRYNLITEHLKELEKNQQGKSLTTESKKTQAVKNYLNKINELNNSTQIREALEELKEADKSTLKQKLTALNELIKPYQGIISHYNDINALNKLVAAEVASNPNFKNTQIYKRLPDLNIGTNFNHIVDINTTIQQATTALQTAPEATTNNQNKNSAATSRPISNNPVITQAVTARILSTLTAEAQKQTSIQDKDAQEIRRLLGGVNSILDTAKDIGEPIGVADQAKLAEHIQKIDAILDKYSIVKTYADLKALELISGTDAKQLAAVQRQISDKDRFLLEAVADIKETVKEVLPKSATTNSSEAESKATAEQVMKKAEAAEPAVSAGMQATTMTDTNSKNEMHRPKSTGFERGFSSSQRSSRDIARSSLPSVKRQP